jgi:sporulation protein YlmC with PRC-barrel domain
MILPRSTVLAVSVASILASTALAQEAPRSPTTKSTSSTQVESPAYSPSHPALLQSEDRLTGAAKASDLIGMTVRNYQQVKLAKVEDLAVDVESGRIVQVVLSIGGFLGVGETLAAVPPGALHHDVAQSVLHLDITPEKLKDAPRFTTANWADAGGSNQLSSVYQYYGQDAAFRFVRDGEAVREAHRDTDGTPRSDATGKPESNADQLRRARDSRSMIPASRLSQVQRASQLMGTPVKNLQDEKLGKVENLLVDLGSGRMVAVIVSSGGFLGLGDELSAIPPNALRFSTDRASLQLDASKEMLTSAPHFRANEWPDFNQPGYSAGVYRAYRMEPYFSTNFVSAADNSSRNRRDRGDRTLTPLDQGNSQADVNTTAQIRKGILAGDNLSVNARNVKVITNQGQVTLRGPVNTDEEKRFIGSVATGIAQVENVDNQLEVE